MKDDASRGTSWRQGLTPQDSGIRVGRLGASFVYWLLAHSYFLPGLYLQRYSTLFGLSLTMKRHSHLPKPLVYRLLTGTLESTSYFELDFAWRSLPPEIDEHGYLDVLSPWLLPLLLILKQKISNATVVNDDCSTLSTLRSLLDAVQLGSRCKVIDRALEHSSLKPESFDAVTSISGPAQVKNDSALVATMWMLVKPGGRLIVTLPCARTAGVQVDGYDQHAKASAKSDRCSARFYDSHLLQKRIFSVLGEPHSTVVYGKIAEGKSKRSGGNSGNLGYPSPREPLEMARNWRCFSRIEDLPGQGVVAMMFIKAPVEKSPSDAESA